MSDEPSGSGEPGGTGFVPAVGGEIGCVGFVPGVQPPMFRGGQTVGGNAIGGAG